MIHFQIMKLIFHWLPGSGMFVVVNIYQVLSIEFYYLRYMMGAQNLKLRPWKLCKNQWPWTWILDRDVKTK